MRRTPSMVTDNQTKTSVVVPVESADYGTTANASLLRIIARAHDIQRRLIQNTKLTVHDIARTEHASAAYLYTLLRLPWLAPDCVPQWSATATPQRDGINAALRRDCQPIGRSSEHYSAFDKRKSWILRNRL